MDFEKYNEFFKMMGYYSIACIIGDGIKYVFNQK